MKKDLQYIKPGTHQKSRFEKIHTIVFEDSNIASKKVAREIADLIINKQLKNENCVLGLATGSSPITVYKELVNIHRKEKLSFSNVITFNLDEYYPISKKNVESYNTFMFENLFSKVDIPKKNINIPNGELNQDKVVDYCKKYEEKIKNLGGLDFQILGIGRTGHIGFNEPGSSINSETRLVKLDFITREDASGSFSGLENVPNEAITMGINTILNAKRIILIAWGEKKKHVILKAVEKKITPNLPASFLQNHNNVSFVLDKGSSMELTRIKTPWVVGSVKWSRDLKTRAVEWLCNRSEKSILRLSNKDYNENHLSDLLVNQTCYDLNIEIFNRIQRTITGWPGGKPNSDDTYRPERKSPYKKRVLIFSPHPDDDVVSMGGTFERLIKQGHDVHVVYQTSGNIAVSNESVLKFLEIYCDIFKISDKKINQVKKVLKNNKEIIPDPFVRNIAGKVREKEAISATRYLGLNDSNVHFLKLPFYESGNVKKNDVSSKDLKLTCDIISKIKPHQLYAAGDLADPHGTHAVCLKLVFDSIELLKTKSFMKNCWVWLYRGAWHEWEVHEIDMAVPLSPEQVNRKRKSIFYHQSQNNTVMFQGDDNREFWKRVEERNREIALQYRSLGMADYQAMETFRRYYF